MAYKFQFGAARLSGSLQLTDGSVVSSSVDDLTAANIVSQIDDGEIGHTKVALENGDILIGDASGFAQNQTMSGDATLAAGGALTIADSAVSLAKQADLAADRIQGRANGAGTGAPQALTAAQVRTIINVEDGATADQSATEIIGLLNSDLGGNFSIGNQASDSLTLAGGLVVGGDLTVQGSTVEIQQAFVVTSSIQFEGAVNANDQEISLTTAEPTADRTITLPDLTGHVPLLAGAVSNANVTANEFAVLDGDSTLNTGITVNATADGFLMNDGGVMKHIRADNLRTFMQTGVSADSATSLRLAGADAIVASNITVSNDVNLVDTSAARTLTMPDISTADIGQLYMIKDAAGNAATNNITIQQSSGNHDLDGQASIVLESDFAAVQLLACSSSNGFFYSIF